MKKNRISFPEIAWITAAVLASGTAIHSTIFKGWDRSWLFYFFAILSIFMFLIRRAIRHRKTG
jgi:hypothetical protein